MDDDARWCRTCTVIQEVDEEALEATCQDCKASDLNKDVCMLDPYFARIWKAVQLKKSGIEILELASTLDDVIAIQSVESEIERVYYEQREEDREHQRRPKDDLMQIDL